MLKRGRGSEQAGNGTARTLTTRGAGATTGPAVIEGTHLIASKVPKGCVQFVGLIATACCNMFAWLEPSAMRSLQRSAGNAIYVVHFKYSVMYTIQYGLQISVMLFKKQHMYTITVLKILFSKHGNDWENRCSYSNCRVNTDTGETS